MSIELMDEHEQGEQVRTWLRENGSAIITGIALGIAGIFGWQWWDANQASQRASAAAQYGTLTEAVERKDRDAAQALVKGIEAEFAGTSYVSLAALQWADMQVEAGELAGAADTLRKARDNNKSAELAVVIDTRLARVLLANGDAEGARSILTSSKQATPSALSEELLGDIENTLGNREAAVQHWQSAYKTYEETLPARRMLEMKLLDAGASVEKADA